MTESLVMSKLEEKLTVKVLDVAIVLFENKILTLFNVLDWIGGLTIVSANWEMYYLENTLITMGDSSGYKFDIPETVRLNDGMAQS